MSTALVEVFNNEPMTTSLAIANGIQMEHSSVIKLVRKYINDLSEFKGSDFKSNPSTFEMQNHEKNSAGVAFQTRPLETKGGIQYQEFAWLNEGQAIFLLTLQRNTEKVVQFKKSLVHAFIALRNKSKEQTNGFNPATFPIQHQADHLVAADRIFRSMIRTSKSCGTNTEQSIHIAGKVTKELTGIDLPAMLNLKKVIKKSPAQAVHDFLNQFNFDDVLLTSIEQLYFEHFEPFCRISNQYETVSLEIFHYQIKPILYKFNFVKSLNS